MFYPDTQEGLIIWFPCHIGRLTSVISSSETVYLRYLWFQSSTALSEQLIALQGKKKTSSVTSIFFSVHLSEPCFITPILFPTLLPRFHHFQRLSHTIPMVEREGIKDSWSSQRSLLINASASFNLSLNNAALMCVCVCVCRICILIQLCGAWLARKLVHI